jgi:O-antigen ligase
MLRLLAAAWLAGVLLWLWRRFRPTPFGLVFGAFFIYLPVNMKFPFQLLPYVNGLTLFLVTLAVLLPGPTGRPRPRSGAFLGIALGFIGLMVYGTIISLAAGSEPGPLLVALKRRLDPIFFGLLALALVHDEDRKFTFSCLALGFAMVAAKAFQESLGVGPTKRVLGLLQQPNATGSFLAMGIPVILGLALFALRGIPRLALLGLFPVAAWAVIRTDSRASMIAFGATVVVFLVASKRGSLALLGILLAGAISLAPNVLPERVQQRFGQTLVDDAEPVGRYDAVGYEPSAAARLQNWTASLRAMAVNPFGYGFDRFKLMIGDFRGIRGLDAHNIFFLLGVELGVAAIFLAVLFFAWLGWTGWSVLNRGRDGFTRGAGIGLLSMSVAAVIVNCFGSRLFEVMTSSALWVIAGSSAAVLDLLPARERLSLEAVGSRTKDGTVVPRPTA